MSARTSEAHHRLSDSALWPAQRRFYERAGIDAWRTNTVPHHVTSNVALATAYARVVAGFLEDRPSARRTPLHVVELGAGSGRFAFLFLRALQALGDVPVRYVMTDVAGATIRFWRTHEALAPFVRDGRLDFARFDAERDGVLRLERARRTIAPDAPHARLVVVANYVFSGLPHDAFAIGAGRVRECLVTARRSADSGGDAADHSLSWRLGAPVTAPYPEDDFNAILRGYAARGVSGRLLFPVGALRCLDRLAALAREDLLVLAADRGTTNATAALRLGADLDLARHGAVSFPVNFHAVRTWLTRRGGVSLRPPPHHRHVHVTGLLVGGSRRSWPATKRAYRAAVGRSGPDALYALRRGLPAVSDGRRAREIVSLMRRCGPDPRVVAECVRPLWPHLAKAGPALRHDVRRAVLAAWPNYYHLGEAHDLAFDLALLLYEARAYADARALFERSCVLYGDDGATRWNLGLCHLALGQPTQARACFQRARVSAPGLPPAGLALVKASDARYSRPSSEAPDTGGRPPRRRGRPRRSSSRRPR